MPFSQRLNQIRLALRSAPVKLTRAASFVSIVEPSTPSYYRVPTGKEFQFSIDYSKLAKDPNADKSGAGYLYAPGRPVAAWS